VNYTSKTAKIKKGEITQQHIAKCQCVVEYYYLFWEAINWFHGNGNGNGNGNGL